MYVNEPLLQLIALNRHLREGLEAPELADLAHARVEIDELAQLDESTENCFDVFRHRTLEQILQAFSGLLKLILAWHFTIVAEVCDNLLHDCITYRILAKEAAHLGFCQTHELVDHRNLGRFLR